VLRRHLALKQRGLGRNGQTQPHASKSSYFSVTTHSKTLTSYLYLPTASTLPLLCLPNCPQC